MTRIEGGLKGIGQVGKGVQADFERIDSRGKKLANTLGGIATAGTLALVGLAKGAPALAGTMAKMKVSMLKFKMAAGEALKPTFEMMSRGLEKIADWVSNHPEPFRAITNSAIGLSAAFALFKVSNLVGITTALTGFLGLSASAGFVVMVGLVATLVAAYLSIKQYISDIKELRESGTVTEKISYAATTGPLGAGPGGKGLGDILSAWLSSKLKRQSRNESELDLEYYV